MTVKRDLAADATPVGAHEDPPSLAGAAKESLVWNAGFQLLRDALQFVTMLVLVRLIAPEAYGQFNLVTSIIGFGAAFGFHSFITHTLIVRSDSEVDYQAHFSFGLLVQGTLFVVMNLAALVLARFPDYAEVAPLVHVMSIVFLLELPSELRRKQLERRLDWRRLRLMHASALVVSAVVSVGMALAGLGVYALLLPGLLVTVPFIVDLFVVEKFRPSLQLALQELRPALSFGAAQLASGFAVRGKQLVESGGLVSLLGYAQLGFFGRAIGLSQMFCGKLATQVAYALFPVLSKIPAGTERYRRAGSLLVALMAWIVIPTSTLLASVAQSAIHVVYGPKWLAVIPILPFAMAVGALAALVTMQGRVLLAAGHASLCAYVDGFIFVATIISILLAGRHGLRYYLSVLAVVYVVAVGGLLVAMTSRHSFDMSWLRSGFVPPIAASAAGAVAVYGLRQALHEGLWPPIELGLGSGVFMTVVIVVLRFGFARDLALVLRHAPLGDRAATLLRIGSFSDEQIPR